jgi:2-methylisocitrate lyase-like PEP mutase family enzyme
MAPADLVDALFRMGTAGCNLEDTDHTTGGLVDMSRHADWLAQVRRAAADRGYGLVINARVDVFLADYGAKPREVMDDAVARARSYLAAGADCVYPIFLHDADTIAAFVDAVEAPVNILAWPQAPSLTQLAKMGVARISYGSSIHRRTMEQLTAFLSDLAR